MNQPAVGVRVAQICLEYEAIVRLPGNASKILHSAATQILLTDVYAGVDRKWSRPVTVPIQIKSPLVRNPERSITATQAIIDFLGEIAQLGKH